MLKEVEIFFRKLFLNLFLFFYGQKKQHHPELKSNSKILFIRLNRIGDALVTTPLFKIFKDNLNCRIDILADKKNHFIFQNNPSIDNVIVFDKGTNGFKSILRKLNSNKYDAVIDLHDDVSTTVTFLVGLLKAKNKIALEKNNSKVYTYTIPKLDSTKNHVIDRLLEIPRSLVLQINENVNVQYFPKKESYMEVEKYLAANKLKDKYLIGINISAGSDARFWGIKRFQKLIDALQKYDLNILLLTAEKDLSKAEEISEVKTQIYYSKSFDEFSAMISKLDFLFTPDTSVIHIASSFHIPLYGLYVKYNTDDIIWYPYSSDYKAFITTDANFENVTFEMIEQDFIKYFETIYYEK